MSKMNRDRILESALQERNIPDADDDSLLTPEDVARRFQVPVSWVYNRCRPRAKSPMPRIKIGHYLRFEEEAVRQYIERQKRGYSPACRAN